MRPLKQNSIQRGAAALLVFFTSLALSNPAFAKVQIKAEPGIGFGDTYASGSWTPLRLMIDNSPDPQHPEARLRDYKGQVRVTIVNGEGKSIRYAQEVDLPARSRKLVEFSVILPASPPPVLIDYVDTREREIARLVIPMNAKSSFDQRDKVRVAPTVLLQNDPNESPSFPTWISHGLNIQRIDLEQLPSDLKGYAEVKLLVARSRVSNRLNPDQLKALEDWVQLGGQLVVVTSRQQDELKLDTWLGPHLPATLTTIEEVKMDDLSPGSSGELALFSIWKDIAPDAKVLWDSPKGPIALARPFGAGRIVALSFDPSALSEATLNTPVGREIKKLLESLLLSPAREDLRARHYWSTADVDPDFSQVLLLPNRWIVAGLMIVFVAVVGPLNFYILRKRRTLELAWVTIPALSLGFFVAVYAYGSYAKGGKQHYASAEILHLTAGNPQGLLLWTSSQFSPSATNYRFYNPKGGTVIPLMPFYDLPRYSGRPFMGNFGVSAGALGAAEGGTPATAILNKERGLDLVNPVGQWAMAFYEGEQPLEIKGSIDGKVTVSADGTTRVHIANNTDAALSNAELYVGAARYQIQSEDLAPHSTFDGPVESSGKVDERDKADPNQNPAIPRPANRKPVVPKPTPIAGDRFQATASGKIRDGAFTSYPIFRIQRPLRRCRLIANQTTWQSEVRIEPKPEFTKVCSLVEVELPLEVEGEIPFARGDLTLQIRKKKGVEPPTAIQALRCEVYDFDRNASFFDDPSDFGSIDESWFDVVLSPPAMDQSFETAKFIGGRVSFRFSGPNDRLVVSAFNFERGNWYPRVEEDKAGNVSNKELSFNVEKSEINPYGHYLRLRFEARPPKQPPESSGSSLPNINFRGTGIVIHSIETNLTFGKPVDSAITPTEKLADASEPGP